MHSYTHADLTEFLHSHVHIARYIYAAFHEYLYTCMEHRYLHAYMYNCTSIPPYVRTYIHIYIHTHVNIQIFADIPGCIFGDSVYSAYMLAHNHSCIHTGNIQSSRWAEEANRVLCSAPADG